MAILDKVLAQSFICSIEVTLNATVKPSAIEGWQPFANSIIEDSDFQKAYATFPSIAFAEESTNSAAGTAYNQKVVFTFPDKDQYRSQRIALLHQVKFIRLFFTDGFVLLVGRNDFSQNAAPEITYKSNGNNAQLEISCDSIFPCGFTPNPNQFGLPSFIPISLTV